MTIQRLESVHVDELSCTTFSPPAGCITNASVLPAAGIAATKLQRRISAPYSQADGSDIAAAIVPVHVVRGATATVVGVDVACVDAPSGGDKAFSVDVQKADEGTPTPATVLTGTIAYSATQSDCEVESGTISASPAALVTGDTVLVVVAVSGSTGTQGQGLIVTVTIDEDAY